MKALSLLCLTLAFAPLAPAALELEYVAYDLASKTVETVVNPTVTDPVYHSGSKILFVRDTTLPDQSYYIGVFELTCDQAHQLGLAHSTTSGGWAYGEFTPSSSSTLPANLHFPTHAEWVAYTDDPDKLSADKKKSINMRGGIDFLGVSLKDWYEQYLCASPSKLSQNSHGVYDIYGNVAEYATDGKGTGPFYGGSAHASDRIEHLAEDSVDNLRNDGKLASRYSGTHQGVRLIYRAPAEQLYTLAVTLDGADVTQNVVTNPVDTDLSALKVGTAVTVTAPKPEGQRRLSGREVTGLDSSLDLPEALDAPLTFDMPASDVTIAYSSEPYATLTVTNGTATVNDQPVTEVEAGDVVTLTARALGAHENFLGWTVTVGAGAPTALKPTEEGVYRYEIPPLEGGETFAFAATFETVPYAVLTVKGGVAKVNDETVTEVVNGDMVTLEHDAPGAHQVFNGWVCPEDIELDGNNRFTVSGLTGAGESLVFEATIQTYPLVRVFGGEVSGVENGRDDDDGYYTPGTTLNLTADGLEGYTHAGWSVNGTETIEGDSYTLAAGVYDVTITLTALYKTTAESGGEVEPGSGATVRLGYTGNEPRTLFGSEVADELTLDDGYGNVYAFPAYVPAGLIATFDLTDGAISYGEPASGAGDPPSKVDYEGTWSQFWQDYMAWWQQAYGSESSHYSPSAFTLRRVTKTDDPYDDFYLGVYEASFGNVANLEALCVPKVDDRLDFLAAWAESACPYCFETESTGLSLTQREKLVARYPVPTLLSMMSGAFGVTVTLPSKSDLVAVAGTPPQNNPEAGRGATKDTAIKESMVACSDNSAVPTATTVNGMDPDPYGFYGIWGSQFESVAEGQIVGGSRHREWRFCHVDAFESIDWGNVYGAGFEATFRPKVAVVRPVTVTVQYRVGSATETIGTVELAPGLLFEDFAVTPVRANHTFLHWELDGAEVTENPTLADGQTAVTLTAVWEKTPDSVTVECEHCLGPATAYPGQKVTVYPPEGQTFDAAAPLTVSPEAAATKVALNEDGTFTVTFASPLPSGGTVTLQGNLAEPPAPPKPGYRFRLR